MSIKSYHMNNVDDEWRIFLSGQSTPSFLKTAGVAAVAEVAIGCDEKIKLPPSSIKPLKVSGGKKVLSEMPHEEEPMIVAHVEPTPLPNKPSLVKMKETTIPNTVAIKPFDLNISTKTKVLFLNKPIDILNIFWKIPIIEYWKPDKGVIKKQIKIVSKTKEELETYKEKLKNINYYQEHIIKQIDNPTSRSIKFKDERKITVGISKKDITVQRIRVKNAFYNCMALILRFRFNGVFKEIHIKVFNTGKMEIPGIVDYSMLEYVKEMILDILREYEEVPVATEWPNIQETVTEAEPPVVDLCFVDNFKEEHVLINSNFNCGYFINRERLYNILNSPKYGLETAFDPCNYSGVKCRYYFNNEYGLDKTLQRGVIMDEDKQMKLFVLMECKKYTEVSLMIFRTGSCIIVGNCSEKILRFIFEFIKEILTVEYENICFNDEVPQVKNKSFKTIKRNIRQEPEI